MPRPNVTKKSPTNKSPRSAPAKTRASAGKPTRSTRGPLTKVKTGQAAQAIAQLPDRELVYGIHPLIELLKARKRKLYKIYTTQPEPKNWNLIAALLPSYTEVVYKERAFLDQLTQHAEHQSVVGLAAPFVIRKQFFAPKLYPFLLLLDNLQDPRNLGAILRSAYCTGVKGVIITTKNSAPITATVLKAAAGLAEHLEIYLTPQAHTALQTLKNNGCQIFLATLERSQSALTAHYSSPLCLVIGNEAQGISRNISGLGQHITLPQVSADVSYNAAVAAGILLFMISTQQQLLK
ncbi:MAG TPA: RNA methyltransferase [Candidatus Babeliales bacterium]|nr:RNA methyltransferase [Candidatus Babeliales bacterium]